MKFMSLIIFSFFTISTVFSNTIEVKNHEVYRGVETYNEHKTGDICYITVRKVDPLPSKGLHCNQISYQFNSKRTELPKEVLFS